MRVTSGYAMTCSSCEVLFFENDSTYRSEKAGLWTTAVFLRAKVIFRKNSFKWISLMPPSRSQAKVWPHQPRHERWVLLCWQKTSTLYVLVWRMPADLIIVFMVFTCLMDVDTRSDFLLPFGWRKRAPLQGSM